MGIFIAEKNSNQGRACVPKKKRGGGGDKDGLGDQCGRHYTSERFQSRLALSTVPELLNSKGKRTKRPQMQAWKSQRTYISVSKTDKRGAPEQVDSCSAKAGSRKIVQPDDGHRRRLQE